MGFYFVDPEIYRKYKDQVLELSQAIQINYPEHLPPEVRKPGLSDRQIADKLGLEERVVREIRCVGEREYYPVDEWEKALEFKDKACREFAVGGLASVTKKLIQKAKEKAKGPAS